MDTVDRRAHNAPDPGSVGPTRGGEPVDVVAERVAAYRPNSVPPTLWTEVASHVRAAVLVYEPQSVSAAYLAMQAATRFAIWAVGRGLSLDPETLYTEANVEFFVASGLPHLSEHSRASYRSSLRRIGRTITHRADWSPQPPRLKRKDLSAPYSDEEIAWLWDIARHQSSLPRQRAARGLMCLAYGAGLRAPEYSVVTSDHVRDVDQVAVVNLGGTSPRTVPVLPEAHEDLRWLIDAVPAGEELFSAHRHIRNFTASVVETIEVPPRAPRFVSRRLRITWMVRVSVAGVRISELGYLAGVKTAKGWDELGKFIPRRDDAELRALIGALR